MARSKITRISFSLEKELKRMTMLKNHKSQVKASEDMAKIIRKELDKLERELSKNV